MTQILGGPPAGWYPDPSGAVGERYWNGATWTDGTRAAMPGPVARPGPANPPLPPRPVPPVPPVPPLAPGAGTWRPADPGPAPASTGTKKRRWPLWTAIGVAVLVLLGVISSVSGKDDVTTKTVSAPATWVLPTTTRVPEGATTAAPTTTAAAPATTTPRSTAAPATTAAARPGTRANPIPLGQAGVLKDADNGDFTVTVNAADLQASAAVAAANMFNSPSSTGEYVIVNVTAAYKGGKEQQSATLLGSLSMSVFGSAGVEHTSALAVAPDPQLDSFAELLDGASLTGNEVFEYEPGATPLLRVEESFCFTNCDQLWFALA